jgi:hypothetical protein
MIRVLLPYHLQTLAQVGREVEIDIQGSHSLGAVLDVLEERYPMLCGTVRNHQTKERRDFIRFFVCGEDWSHEPMDTQLPNAVVTGTEPFRIVGALAGG